MSAIFFNFELQNVSIANGTAKFQALFHIYNSPIIMQYWLGAVCF